MRKNLIIAGLLFFSFALQAQNGVKLHLAIEAGGNILAHELLENWPVRQDAGSYFMGNSYVSGSIVTDAYLDYFGVKPQLQFNDRLTLSTGARFSMLGSNIEPRSGSDYHFFLRRNTQDQNQTEYFRVNGIEEQNLYIGVPLEIKFKLFEENWMRGLGIYLMAGADIGFLVNSKQSISFLNSEMKRHEAEFFKTSEISKAFSNAYGGLSFQYTSPGGYIFNISTPVIHQILSKNNSKLVELSGMGTGAQFSIAIPLIGNKQNLE